MSRQEVAMTIDNQSFRSRLSKNSSNRYDESSFNSDDNEFLKGYANGSNYYTINASKPAEGEGPPRRLSLIQELGQKNQMLRKEVERVELILNTGEKGRGPRLPELNGNVMKKELQNAYKQIKFYEVEVGQRQKLFEHEGYYVDMIRKAERNLVERQELGRKLQAEISEMRKQSNEFMKLLQDGHIQKEYASRSSKLHKEIKYYEGMLAEQEGLTSADRSNGEDKKGSIMQMEEELIKGGFPKAELLQLRRKFEAERGNQTLVTQKKEQCEDRSKQAFEDLKGEMNIFRKMQKDYSKKIEELERQKDDACEKSGVSREKLEQTEQELERLEIQFAEMKKSIDPVKLKPVFKNGGLNQSSISQFGGKGKGDPLEHQFQTAQSGISLKKGQTNVNDRPVIGKKSAKIIELTLYENRTQFLGFQATYLIGETEKKGNVNVLKKQNERFMRDKSYRLDPGDYYRTFQLTVNKQNVIVGLTSMSFQGKVVTAGSKEGFKRELGMGSRQFPCCLYGCYSDRGFELLGVEKVEAA